MRAPVALLVLLVALTGCEPVVLRDPGYLRIDNWLADDVIAILAGRPLPVRACSTLELVDIELRDVRIVTQTGIDLLRRLPAPGIAIGPQRYIAVEEGDVVDLRTAPRRGRPRGAGCTTRVAEHLQRRDPAGGVGP